MPPSTNEPATIAPVRPRALTSTSTTVTWGVGSETTFTIIGVTPPGFFGLDVGRTFDVAIPLGIEPLIRGKESSLDRRSYWWLTVIGRLKADQSLEAAQAGLRGVQPQIREPMLVRGEIDFAAAWVMTAVPSLLGLGVKRDDINVIADIPAAGAKLFGRLSAVY